MKFARQEIRDNMAGISWRRRQSSALVIAIAANLIVTNMVNPKVYAAAGLDQKAAAKVAKNNPHRKAMLRNSCVHLMQFLGECGLLTPAAVRVYRATDMM